MNEGTNDLSNGTMDRFNDRVGGGCIGGNPDGSDARIIQVELEIMASESGTIVVDNTDGCGGSVQAIDSRTMLWQFRTSWALESS